MLPNLIVIGAPKCGTTALHRYLGLRPEIAMAEAKELDFFAESFNWKRGLDWYEAHFRPAPVRGESSTSYTRYPRVGGVPERMASVVPQARLVYLVRDPIERVISDYRFRRWVMGTIEGDIRTFVGVVEHSQAVATSSYAFQLEQYLGHFPKQQILVVDGADLRARAEPTLAGIFCFVGVDDTFTTDEFLRPYGETDGLHANALGRAVRSMAFRTVGQYEARAFRSRIPQRLQRALLSRPTVPPVILDPGLREELEAHFKPDVDRLRMLTGQRFESWSV